MESRSQIKPEILQEFMDSCLNPTAGQSQYFSPIPFGRKLAEALPGPRPIITDLTCGEGTLLRGVAKPSVTTHLLGSDIDPCRAKLGAKVEALDPANPTLPVTRITRDLTRLFPMLVELDWHADLFALNPPWSLWWFRDRLAALADSDLPAVRDAFASHEDGAPGRCPKEGIDSTIATLAIALDRCTLYGEGLLIANDATLERLLFAAGAPHVALARHIWLHLKVPGNPMTGIQDCNFQHENVFHTGVIYFARDHETGPKHITLTDAAELAGLQLQAERTYRQGAELRNEHWGDEETLELWTTAKERIAEEDGAKPKVPFNLWLGPGGRIKADLSRFEQHSTKVNKKEAARLFALRDKRPMELVLQRAQRDELLHCSGPASGWRVHPDLIAAVQHAVASYHAARAPLYPLPEIQRLGYLDEQDTIECTLDLGEHFQAGKSYPLRTQTVPVTRLVVKPNAFTGEDEKLEFTGQELALFLKAGTDDEATELCFMDAKLKDDPNTKVGNACQQKHRSRYAPEPEKQPIDYSLQDLCGHFRIPEVPDVATVDPKRYERNLALLEQLEALTAA